MSALEWIESNLLALITLVLVPLLVVWIRFRTPLSSVAAGLSQSEAKFRADLILRHDALTRRLDELNARDCERQHQQSQMAVARLEAEIEELRRGR